MHHATPHVHRAVVVDIKCRAFAFEGCGGLHIEQVGAWVGLQAVAVGTDVGIVAHAWGDEQSANRVSSPFHLADDGFQVGEPFLIAFG